MLKGLSVGSSDILSEYQTKNTSFGVQPLPAETRESRQQGSLHNES